MMKKLLGIAVLSLCALALAAPSEAQHSRGGARSRGSAGVRGGVVGRPGGVVVAPRVGPGYRSYYYPRFSFGLYAGYPWYYSPYYYPYGYYGAWGGPYGYPYGGGYYVDSRTARGVGGLQIKDAPEDAQVFADGYYAGNVDDFDGAFQHLDLPAGPHHIEIREQGQPPIAFDVNIQPGQNVTYHAK
jgi:hypothetical protein